MCGLAVKKRLPTPFHAPTQGLDLARAALSWREARLLCGGEGAAEAHPWRRMEHLSSVRAARRLACSLFGEGHFPLGESLLALAQPMTRQFIGLIGLFFLTFCQNLA